MSRPQATPSRQRVHATCVAWRLGRQWQGVLLRGPSGAGKSDLALRLIENGARLVADDQTELTRRDGRVIASVPASIAGLIEARGLGIVTLPRDQLVKRATVALLVDLAPTGRIERLPEPPARPCWESTCRSWPSRHSKPRHRQSCALPWLEFADA